MHSFFIYFCYRKSVLAGSDCNADESKRMKDVCMKPLNKKVSYDEDWKVFFRNG
jgi:hypothetical protein